MKLCDKCQHPDDRHLKKPMGIYDIGKCTVLRCDCGGRDLYENM